MTAGKQPDNPVTGHARLRRFLLAAILMVAFIGGLLSLLPYAIEKGAVAWLQQHGVADARIANIDLNLFSGEVLVEGLQSGDGLNIDHLRVDFEWLPLWHHIIHIRTLKLSRSNLHVLEQQGIWQVAGIQAGAGQSDKAKSRPGGQDNAWRVVVDDLLLDAVNMKVKTDLFAVSLPLKSLRLSLSGLEQQQQHMVNHIEIGKMSFSGFGYSLRLAGATVAAEIAFSLQHTDMLASLQTKQLSLGLQGLVLEDAHDKHQLSISGLKLDGVTLADKHRIHVKSTVLTNIRIRHALSGQGDVRLAGMQIHGLDAGMDGGFAVAKLVLRKLSAEAVGGHRQSVSIAAATLADIAMPAGNQHQARHVRIALMGMKEIVLKRVSGEQGHVRLKQISLAGLDVGFGGSITLATLGLSGVQAEAWSPDNQSVHLESAKLAGLAIGSGDIMRLKSLSMDKVNLLGPNQSGPAGKQRLLAFDHASLQQFVMHGPESGSVALLTFEGVQLPADNTISLGSIGRIQARQASLATGGAYHVKQLQIDQLQAHLVKQQNGWLLPAGITGKQSKRSAQQVAIPQTMATPSGSTAAKGRFVMDSVSVGAGSRITLRDASVSPALTTTMQIKHCRLAPLDASGQQRGTLAVQMQLGKSGTLSLNGVTNIAPGKRLRADMHLVLKNLDLPPLSGYVEPDLGRSIKTGQFNLDSDISIKDNIIDSKNRVRIRKLALEQPRHGHQSGPKISLAGGMSVDMALGMLLDERGDITLNVPVSGPLDNPDINLNQIINKALLASLKTGALTYAALALQPYGSIILVADVARGIIKDAAKPKLTPIRFPQRKASLSADMHAYIGKIATLMKKKDFRLQVCGIATRTEGEAQPGRRSGPESGDETLPAGASGVQPALDDAQLLQLAQQRSDVVMAALRALGIADKQVFNCHPGIDASKQQAQPRVELLLDY